MLSAAPERPVPPITVEVLTILDRVARDLSLDYFVAGAMARDILLHHVFGLETGRATLDVDLGVAVESWAQFDAMKVRLIETRELTADDRTAHRLFYRKTTGHRGYPLDLLPFGNLEQRPHLIIWPPDLSTVMNVAGYREALAAAQQVEISPDFVIPVVSLPALAILKVLAWVDRGADNPKDALDFVLLLRTYHDAGNTDRLFDEEDRLLEAVAYDIELAGPRLLGKDAARVMHTSERPPRDRRFYVAQGLMTLTSRPSRWRTSPVARLARAGERNPRDLGVPEIDRTATTLSPCRKRRGLFGGGGVEGGDTPAKVVTEHGLERSVESVATPAARKKVDTETNLEHGDGGGPDGLGRLRVQPGDDDRVRARPHQRGENVPVEQDHRLKRAGRAA